MIPNWADGSALHPIHPDTNPLRTEWGLEGKFVVGYSGNMGRAHEFQTIIDAAAALRRNATLCSCSSAAARSRLGSAEMAAQRQINALFKPYQPRAMLAQSLGVADVHFVSLRPALEGLVVPSKFYGITAVGRPAILIGDKEGEIGKTIGTAACGPDCARRRFGRAD